MERSCLDLKTMFKVKHLKHLKLFLALAYLNIKIWNIVLHTLQVKIIKITKIK